MNIKGNLHELINVSSPNTSHNIHVNCTYPAQTFCNLGVISHTV